jgi:pilus assembly protein CpaE
MKIKVISPVAGRSEQVAHAVRGADTALEVHSATAPMADLTAAVNGSRPALLLLDGVDSSALEAVERFTSKNPQIETIVISSEPSQEFLMKAMRIGVREVLPAASDAAALRAAVQRAARRRTPAVSTEGSVLAFMSCKGGSGATFLSTNLAQQLSERSKRRVGLIDLDLQFGNVLQMLSSHKAVSHVAEVARQVHRLDEDLLRSAMVPLSETLHVLAAPAAISEALEVKAAHVEAIIRQARQMFDIVVLDLGGYVDAVSLQAVDLATHVFPVLQLNVLQMRDALRLRTLLASLDVPAQKLQWIVNRYDKRNALEPEALQKMLGEATTVHLVPNDFRSASAAVNQGVPLAQVARSSPALKALNELAARLAPVEAVRKEGWFSGLFGGH